MPWRCAAREDIDDNHATAAAWTSGFVGVDTTALYTRVATKTISEVMSPLEQIALKLREIRPPG
jgi:hypothetical protein